MSGQEADLIDAPKATLIPDHNSLYFTPRCLYLNQCIKIGRAFGKSFKPASNNAFFDCKVLSRHHAQLFYQNGKFYLQDTKSSNGTFVNSTRLSPANTESSPCQIYHGDTVQFGVEVLDNERNITINCIVAKLELYHANGKEALRDGFQIDYYSEPSKSEITLMTQYMALTSVREKALQVKLAAIGEILEKVQSNTEERWKYMIEEDRLLRRIEFLQDKLESVLDSSMKNPDLDVVSLQKKLVRVQEEKEAYETKAKEAVEKVLLENLSIVSKNTELELLLNAVEEQKDLYKNACDKLVTEIKRLNEEDGQNSEEVKRFKFENKNDEASERGGKVSAQEPHFTNTCDLEKKPDTDQSDPARELLNSLPKENKDKENHSDIVDNTNSSPNVAITKDKANSTVVHRVKFESDENLERIAPFNNFFEIPESSVNLTYEETLKPLKVMDVNASIFNHVTDNLENEVKVEVMGIHNDVKNSQVENDLLVVDDENRSIDKRDKMLQLIEDSIIELEQIKHQKVLDELNELKQRFEELSNEHENCMELRKDDLLQFEGLQKEYDRILLQNKGYGETFTLFTEKESKFIEDIAQLNAKYENALVEINQLKASVKEYQNNNLVNLESALSKKNLVENESLLQIQSATPNSDNNSDIIISEEPVPKDVSLNHPDSLTNLEDSYKSLSDDDRSYPHSSINQEDDAKHISDVVLDPSSLRPSPQEDSLVKTNLQESEEVTAKSTLEDSPNSSFDLLRDPHVNDVIEKELGRLRNLQQDYELKSDVLQRELKSLEDELDIISYQNKTASVCAIVPLLILFFAIIFAYYPTFSNVTATMEN